MGTSGRASQTGWTYPNPMLHVFQYDSFGAQWNFFDSYQLFEGGTYDFAVFYMGDPDGGDAMWATMIWWAGQWQLLNISNGQWLWNVLASEQVEIYNPTPYTFYNPTFNTMTNSPTYLSDNFDYGNLWSTDVSTAVSGQYPYGVAFPSLYDVWQVSSGESPIAAAARSYVLPGNPSRRPVVRSTR